jgi:hypothetical protein
MFHAEDSDGTTDQAELDALQSVISRFPGTRAAREANIDAAKLDLAASRLDSARVHLDAASDDPSLASDVDPLRRKLEALIADSPPGSAPGSTQATEPRAATAGSTATRTTGPASQSKSERLLKKKIEMLLSEAENLWDQRDLDEAEKRVNRVLKIDKDNHRALELQEKIRKRKELLEKY